MRPKNKPPIISLTGGSTVHSSHHHTITQSFEPLQRHQRHPLKKWRFSAGLRVTLRSVTLASPQRHPWLISPEKAFLTQFSARIMPFRPNFGSFRLPAGRGGAEPQHFPLYKNFVKKGVSQMAKRKLDAEALELIGGTEILGLPKRTPYFPPDTSKDGLCDAIYLAGELGISSQRVNQLAREGIIPRVQHGGRFFYDRKIACAAYLAHQREVAAGRERLEKMSSGKRAIEDEKLRLTRAQAEAQEMKNRLQQGKLLDAEAVKHAWTSTLAGVRAAMLSIPSRV
jgi:phage terminase Nu1 subunit (DNA packaging protein)